MLVRVRRREEKSRCRHVDEIWALSERPPLGKKSMTQPTSISSVLEPTRTVTGICPMAQSLCAVTPESRDEQSPKSPGVSLMRRWSERRPVALLQCLTLTPNPRQVRKRFNASTERDAIWSWNSFVGVESTIRAQSPLAICGSGRPVRAENCNYARMRKRYSVESTRVQQREGRVHLPCAVKQPVRSSRGKSHLLCPNRHGTERSSRNVSNFCAVRSGEVARGREEARENAKSDVRHSRSRAFRFCARAPLLSALSSLHFTYSQTPPHLKKTKPVST